MEKRVTFSLITRYMQEIYSIHTSASPEKIWHIWSDVKNWHKWEPSIIDAQIKGSFSKDAEGFLQPENWPRTRIRISSCEDLFSYTVNASFPFAKMYIRRLIGYDNNKSIITNEVWMEGPLSGFWWRLVGKKYKQMLPQVMDRFRKLAEN